MKLLILFISVIFMAGCGKNPSAEKDFVVKVNNYKISKEEFDAEFSKASFGRAQTPEAKKEFLNNLIISKLVLQDAQRKGYDKDPSFLKMVERFWEQSLLSIALDRKNMEIAAFSFADEMEIKNRYDKMVKEGKADKPYDQMYMQLKWSLIREKQGKMMEEWISRLRKTANVQINEKMLK